MHSVAFARSAALWIAVARSVARMETTARVISNSKSVNACSCDGRRLISSIHLTAPAASAHGRSIEDERLHILPGELGAAIEEGEFNEERDLHDLRARFFDERNG